MIPFTRRVSDLQGAGANSATSTADPKRTLPTSSSISTARKTGRAIRRSHPVDLDRVRGGKAKAARSATPTGVVRCAAEGGPDLSRRVMAIGSVFLAFVAGALSVLSPCDIRHPPIVLGAAALFRASVGARLPARRLGSRFRSSSIGLDSRQRSATPDRSRRRRFSRRGSGAYDRHWGNSACAPWFAGLQLALCRRAACELELAGTSTPLRLRRSSPGQLLAGGCCLARFGAPASARLLGAAALLAAQGRDSPAGWIGDVRFWRRGRRCRCSALGMTLRQSLFALAQSSALGGIRGENRCSDCCSWPSALLVLSGLDKTVETALVNASPQWLTDLTTRLAWQAAFRSWRRCGKCDDAGSAPPRVWR